MLSYQSTGTRGCFVGAPKKWSFYWGRQSNRKYTWRLISLHVNTPITSFNLTINIKGGE